MSYTPRIEPDHETTEFPRGIPFIIGNEGCERFSFYGMKAILYTYVVWLYTSVSGLSEAAAADEATATVHLFITGVYAFPMIGAIIADRFAGKYNTIMWLSLVYCLGHAVMAVGEGTLWGLYAGLALISIGAGGIKPCVSAHVGDQFGRGNWFRLERIYQAFYFIINFGSFFATMLIPVIKEHYGVSVAFAIPGVLMFIATIFFWMGRKVFVHIPAKPGGRIGALDAISSILLFMVIGSLFFTATMPWYVILGASISSLVAGLGVFALRQKKERDLGFLAVTLYSLRAKLGGTTKDATTSEGDENVEGEEAPKTDLRDHWFFGPAARAFGNEVALGPLAVFRIISVFLMVSFFWALFDQHSSSWIRQAQMMNLTFDMPFFPTFDVLPEQIQSANPVMVMILIPLVGFGLVPLVEKFGIEVTPLRKMTAGMFLAGISFVLVAVIQSRIDAGYDVHVAWQFLPFTVITLSEVLVSITGLEFAYSQAPTRMKSTIMGFWLLTVALGNVLVALLARFGGLALVDFFWTFAGLMFIASVLFGIRARFYKYTDFAQ